MHGRKFGTIALLGAGTAALALLTGLSSARADDLKVNQQVLSERLDQIAAMGLQPGAGAYLEANPNKAAGAPVTAGSFPRSILIPGTETSIRIGGQITEIMDYWMSGGNPNASPQSTTVGINGQVQSTPLGGAARSRSNGIFLQSPRESKINFETRTPTAFGEARTVMEFDWAGSTTFSPGGADPTSVSDNLAPRLRYAYGTLGGFLAGQATSNFSDPDGNQETLDFGGNAGNPGVVRVPQVRYTMPFGIGSFSVSAETPETDLGTPSGISASDAGVIPTISTVTCTALPCTITPALRTSGPLALNPAKATSPDFTMAYYIAQPWGHIDLSAVIRPGLDVTDGGLISKQFIGYGGHLGFSWRPGFFGPKDVLSGHIVAGDALGRYLNSSSNFALATNFVTAPTTAAGAAAIIVKPTTELGGNIGYQHWWSDNLRSNVNYGINQHNIPSTLVGAAQAGAMNRTLQTMHANIIWNPVSFVDVGLEYMWGRRSVVSGASAEENVLISKFAFRF